MVSQVDKLQAQQESNRRLQRDLNRRLQQAQLRKQQQAIQQQQKEEQVPSIDVSRIETEISSFKDNLTFENYAEKYAQLSEEAKKYVDPPSKIRESSSYKQYQSEKESIKAINKEISEWKQAEKIYFKIISGAYTKSAPKYDPRSSVGRKVNSLFTQYQKAQAYLQRLNAKQDTLSSPTGVVFVDGKGFSVAPHLQEDFVKSFDVSPKIQQVKKPFEIEPPKVKDIFVKKEDLAKEFQLLSSEEGIGGMSKMETMKFEETSRKRELPYGLGEAVRFIQDPSSPEGRAIIKGEKFNPWLFPFYISSKVITKDVNEKVGDFVKGKPTLNKYSSKGAEFIASLTGGLILGAFFQPAMVTGATKKGAKTKQKTETKQKPKTKPKADLDKLKEELQFKREGNVLRDKTTFEKREDVRKLFDTFKKEIQKVKSSEQKKKLTNDFLKFLDDTYGKTQSRNLLKEIISQETNLGFSQPLPSPPSRVPPKVSEGLSIGRVKGLDLTFKMPTTLEKAGLLTGLITGTTPKAKPKQVDITKTIGLSIPKQIPKTTPKPKPRLKQPVITLEIPKLETPVIEKPKIPLPTKPFFPYSPTLPKPTPKTTKPKFPKIPKFDIEKRKKLPIINPNQPSHVFVKSRGRNVKVTKKPIRYEDALDYGAFIVDRSLPAQFSIKKASGKPSKLDIKIPQNYFKLQGYKFRPYKVIKKERIPLQRQFIERSPYRLDTSGEVQKIQLEKFLAQQRKQSKSKTNYQKNLDKLFQPTKNKRLKKFKLF